MLSLERLRAIGGAKTRRVIIVKIRFGIMSTGFDQQGREGIKFTTKLLMGNRKRSDITLDCAEWEGDVQVCTRVYEYLCSFHLAHSGEAQGCPSIVRKLVDISTRFNQHPNDL